MEIGMIDFIFKIIENSIGAGIALILLWVFLPRLLKLIDNMDRRNGKEHEAVLLMLAKIESHMIWHEAKVYGVNPSVGDTDTEIHRNAEAAFRRNLKELESLQESIKRIFEHRTDSE